MKNENRITRLAFSGFDAPHDVSWGDSKFFRHQWVGQHSLVSGFKFFFAAVCFFAPPSWIGIPRVLERPTNF
ncbi:MAG: hypothetical protein A2048_08700 [Deltaproteobacteria bacterium GWA2_45_12]|nr:MAG: hypothetical protein A2048_08700 [Deltaproteobacteria bacterium GWA2_45_12]